MKQHIDIRVMSYNVQYGTGMDGIYNVERIAATILESGADLVGLQEVDVHWGSRSQYEDMAQSLARLTKMNVFFAPIYDLPPEQEGEPNRQFGVALLSRFPIVKADNLPLTRLSTQHQPPEPKVMSGMAEVLVEVDGQRLSVYVTHLDYRTDPAVRIKQVEEMLGRFRNHANPTMLLGDFNARPDAPELSPLFERLQDSWTDANGEDPGHTYPADVPDRKIDYILLSSEFRTMSSEIVHTLASDHRPIVANVRIARSLAT